MSNPEECDERVAKCLAKYHKPNELIKMLNDNRDVPKLKLHKIFDIYVLNKLKTVMTGSMGDVRNYTRQIDARIKFIDYLSNDGHDPEQFITDVENILNFFRRKGNAYRSNWHNYASYEEYLMIKGSNNGKWFARIQIYQDHLRNSEWSKVVTDGMAWTMTWDTPDDLYKILKESYLVKIGTIHCKMGEGLQNVSSQTWKDEKEGK
jgi:hypothetical protein